MKRFLITLICILLITTVVYADDEYNSYLKDYDLSAFEELPDEARDVLDELGIGSFDYENISSISIEGFLKHITDLAVSKSTGPISSGLMVICFVILSSFIKSFGNELGSNDLSFQTISCLVVSVFLVVRLSDCMGICYSTIELCSNFAFAFFPVFCIIVATSGGAATSFSANTLLLTLAQGLNVLSRSFFIPVTNCFLAVSICSGIRSELNLNGVISFLRKIIIDGISILSTVFVTVLSVKTAVSAKADALGLRSVRFAINSVVPVIGGSISEGLLSIQTYSGLIKTSVGVVGIISVVLIFLPAIVEVTLWRFTLYISQLCAELFSDEASSKAVGCFKDMLLIVNVILILSMVTTIISIGILIAAKTGA